MFTLECNIKNSCVNGVFVFISMYITTFCLDNTTFPETKSFCLVSYGEFSTCGNSC